MSRSDSVSRAAEGAIVVWRGSRTLQLLICVLGPGCHRTPTTTGRSRSNRGDKRVVDRGDAVGTLRRAFVLPYPQNRPTGSFQLLGLTPVAFDVGLQLRLPPAGVVLW